MKGHKRRHSLHSYFKIYMILDTGVPGVAQDIYIYIGVKN